MNRALKAQPKPVLDRTPEVHHHEAVLLLRAFGVDLLKKLFVHPLRTKFITNKLGFLRRGSKEHATGKLGPYGRCRKRHFLHDDPQITKIMATTDCQFIQNRAPIPFIL